MEELKLGKYQHYKGKIYEVLGKPKSIDLNELKEGIHIDWVEIARH